MTDDKIDGLVPMPDKWQALREALDAGPDEGPWVSTGPSYGAALPVYCNEVVIDREGDDEDTYQVCSAPLGLDAESTANMNYIGAASPKVIRALLDERDRLAKEVEALKDAARINLENYEFQRNKADAATATVYQFHYAIKDAGWHPGRTDDNLCDIIRAKGKELSDALDVLRMVDDNIRVDAGEDRKAWRGDFVEQEVRRIVGGDAAMAADKAQGEPK